MSIYVSDLVGKMAKEQDIAVLFPGSSSLFSKKRSVIIDKGYKKENNIRIFELKNPVPIPLLSGVKNPEDFLFGHRLELSDKSMEEFYMIFSPDIIHIHTLMGFPPELIVFLKKKGTRIIFTPHDYYGICPKVNFINQKGLFCEQPDNENCSLCNISAPSVTYTKLRNNPVLLNIAKEIPSCVKVLVSRNSSSSVDRKSDLKILNFEKWFEYYRNIILKMDLIHFNSYITYDMYHRFFDVENINCKVLPVLHSRIVDNRIKREYNQEKIRLGYIGSTDPYKGFVNLYNILNELKHIENLDSFELIVFGGGGPIPDLDTFVEFRGSYSQSMLNDVFDAFDVLIVPSICMETLSLVAVEALSYGVPVIMSNRVGAKLILEEYGLQQFIYGDNESLKELLRQISCDRSVLANYNEKIMVNDFKYVFTAHIEQLKNDIYSIK